MIIPVAFYAVTSIAVIGLYLAFAIPIWLRWRMGDAFEAGSWNNGKKYKWMNLIAVDRDRRRLALPDDAVRPRRRCRSATTSSWKFVNYAPIVTFGALLILAIWWKVSAKHWFTGPKHTIDEAVVEAFDEG